MMIACGHNNIATAGLACAIAVKKLLEEGHTTGKVVLFGTPSEGMYIYISDTFIQHVNSMNDN